MNRIGWAASGVLMVLLFSGAEKAPTADRNYADLEDRLRAATAQDKLSEPSSLQLGNYASLDNPQNVNTKLVPVAKGSSINYVRMVSSLGAERAFFAVPGNLTRAYFSGAAVASERGGPWSSFDPEVAPPIYPQSVGADLAIGPPPELLKQQIPNLDIIPFNVRPGDRAALFEYFNVDENCRTGGYQIAILDPPKHGDINVVVAKFDAANLIQEAFHFQRENGIDSRSKCQLADFPAGTILYAAKSGYTGRDSATILIKDHGYESIERFVVRVLPKGG